MKKVLLIIASVAFLVSCGIEVANVEESSEVSVDAVDSLPAVDSLVNVEVMTTDSVIAQ